MKLTLNDNDGRYIIHSYENGQITINGTPYGRSLIITPSKITADWQPQTIAELTAEHLAQVDISETELVILGTGKKQKFPPAQILEPLIRHGIGCEVMDTHAACRTYNILVGEDRKVMAALIIE